MSVTNVAIAQALDEMAQILRLLDENVFRVRAYDRAAEQIRSMTQDVAELYRQHGVAGLQELPSIGKDLAEKIGEYVETGSSTYLHSLQEQVLAGLLAVCHIPGMGPKRTRFVWQKFGVESMESLEELLHSGALEQQPGWGEKSVARLNDALQAHAQHAGRITIQTATELADALVKDLRTTGLCDRIEIAGSLRRGKETIGDIDILACSTQEEAVMQAFCAHPSAEAVIARGPTKSSIRLQTGVQVDLRIVDAEVFGAALQYFTGSKEHNIQLRARALRQGVTLSEYGVYRGTAAEKGALLASRHEEDVYAALGLPCIQPELREGRGEIEAAEQRMLPSLIVQSDVRGDMHMHTDWSDGAGSITDMALAAKERGYEYIAITDHASAMGMVRGIKEETIDAYVESIVVARQSIPDVQILSGAEVDIQKDGSLYLSDDALNKLDWVVASIHSHFDLPSAQQTERVLRAIAHPAVRVLGHPTGRHLLRREPIQMDVDAIFTFAAAQGVLMEINAASARLDLNDVLIRKAMQAGVGLILSSDAHHPRNLDVQFGVLQARRGWLEASHVFNTRPLEEWIESRAAVIAVTTKQ